MQLTTDQKYDVTFTTQLRQNLRKSRVKSGHPNHLRDLKRVTFQVVITIVISETYMEKYIHFYLILMISPNGKQATHIKS